MLIAKGVISHFALPLALAAAGGGLLASAEAQYDAASSGVRHSMQLDRRPESLAPRTSGEVACWQVSDASIREAQVAQDYQGNIYMQDGQTGKLRVLRLHPGFRLNGGKGGDWMSDKLSDQAVNGLGTL